MTNQYSATELVQRVAKLIEERERDRRLQTEHAKRLIAKGRSTRGEPYIIETERNNAQPS